MVVSTSIASTTTTPIVILFLFLFHVLHGGSSTTEYYDFLIECENENVTKSDKYNIDFAKNLEYLEAEFFSWGAFGQGLDKFRPYLARGGPSPIGGQRAQLSPFIRSIIAQFALQEYGHLRAIERTIKGSPRPLLNISRETFATLINNAFEKPLQPPFNAYANDINYLIVCYIIPYVGMNGYVGSNPNLISPCAKRLVGGLLGVEAGQDAVIRTLLYKLAFEIVHPYNITVQEFTNKISFLRDKLGKKGLKDEGIIVAPPIGAEGVISANTLAGDKYSLTYARTPEEILNIVYGTGNASRPDGFYPEGANGHIARYYLHEPYY